MSYFMTEEQELIRNVARQFAQEEVEPLAIEMDREEKLPLSLIKRAAELNFFGLGVPTEYGGTGSDFTTECIVLEEVAKASPSFAGLISVLIGLTPTTILKLGTEAQKRKYLPGVASGKRLIAWSSTEPVGAGNITAMQTRLTPDGDGYRLNGLKIFCTQGPAEVYIVLARTNLNGQEGYGACVIEKGMPGFEVGKYEDKLGWRGTNTGTISFKNVHVPKENILGDLLTGAMGNGPGPYNGVGFIGQSATSLGCAEGIYEKTLEYVKQRQLYDAPMASLQPITYWLSDCRAKIEACRSMVYSATRLYDEGRWDVLMPAATKAFVSETAFQISNTCLQMWGCHGISNATGINRYMRDARAKLVAEGSTEMHLAAVAAVIFEQGTS